MFALAKKTASSSFVKANDFSRLFGYDPSIKFANCKASFLISTNFSVCPSFGGW